MKRQGENQAQYAIRLLVQEREREIIEMIEEKLQQFDSWDVGGITTSVEADLAAYAAEIALGSVLDELRGKMAEDNEGALQSQSEAISAVMGNMVQRAREHNMLLVVADDPNGQWFAGDKVTPTEAKAFDIPTSPRFTDLGG